MGIDDNDRRVFARAALFAAIGISYIFLSRTAGTLLPGIFENISVSRLNALLAAASAAALTLFYYYFYSRFTREENVALRNAALIMTLGQGLVAILMLKSMFGLFERRILSSGLFDAFAPWLAAAAAIYFFIVLRRTAVREERGRFAFAALLALIGSILAIGIRSVVALNFIAGRGGPWLSSLGGWPFIAGLPLTAYILAANLYFFIVCRDEADNRI